MSHRDARIRLLLVDDHLVVRIGLRSLLEVQPDMLVVAEAAGGTSAIAAFDQHRPDVTLMDLRMPDLSGTEATAAIRKKHPRPACWSSPLLTTTRTFTGRSKRAPPGIC
jgi:two-component system NarL family response regulator